MHDALQVTWSVGSCEAQSTETHKNKEHIYTWPGFFIVSRYAKVTEASTTWYALWCKKEEARSWRAR